MSVLDTPEWADTAGANMWAASGNMRAAKAAMPAAAVRVSSRCVRRHKRAADGKSNRGQTRGHSLGQHDHFLLLVIGINFT